MTTNKLGLALAFVALLAAACGTTHGAEGVQGGETNWLSACDDDSSCGEGSCMCEVCSEGCDDDDDCPDGLECRGPDSTLVRNACGVSDRGMCAPQCERDDDCGGGQVCDDEGACTLVASTEDGPFQVFSVAAMSPDPLCEVTVDGSIVPVGSFDITSGATPDTNGCDAPYRVHLSVASINREIVMIEGAEVALLTLDRRPIVFNRSGGVTLPNPFDFTGSRTLLPPADEDSTTQGIVTVDVIPRHYTEELSGFTGNQILAEIRLNATNRDGEPIAIAPFLYPIDICVGCMSLCLARDVTDSTLDPEDVYGDLCADNAGADGRICIDPDC
jgi:hypothetical protein